MLRLVIFLGVLGMTLAQFRQQPPYQPQYQQPQQPQQQGRYFANPRSDLITILRSENQNDGAGNFKWSYENSDGTFHSQNGFLKAPRSANEEPIQVIQGNYKYTDPYDNKNYALSYTADENGFQPQADYLPTPPPIPEAIQKALAIIYANAQNQINQAQQPTPQPYRPTPQPYRPTPQPYRPTPQPYRPTPQPYRPIPTPTAQRRYFK